MKRKFIMIFEVNDNEKWLFLNKKAIRGLGKKA